MSTWPAIIDLLAVLSGLLPMIFEIDLRILRALRLSIKNKQVIRSIRIDSPRTAITWPTGYD